MYKLCTSISIPSTPVHGPSIKHILDLSQQHHRAKKRAHDSITEEDLEEVALARCPFSLDHGKERFIMQGLLVNLLYFPYL
jgi:hypothetical protein